MPNNFQSNQRQAGEVTILDLEGKLLHTGADELRNQVNQLLAANRKKFILNLEKLTAIDSTGFGCLAACHSSITQKGGALRLLNPTGHVRIALGWTRLSNFLETHTDEQAALASLS